MQWINYFPEKERVCEHGVHFYLPSSLWDVRGGEKVAKKKNNTTECRARSWSADWL